MHKEALVANTAWQIRGQYLETCNCAYLCPCILTHSAARPTQGNCTVAMVFHVEQGRYGDVALDGLSFAVLARTPGPMREPNWSVGLIVDRQASPAQQEALTKIGSGEAGGPLAGIRPLTTQFLGVEVRPIKYEQEGMTRAASIPDVLDQAVKGVAGRVNRDEPLYIDNVGHPANSRLALARATRNHIHAFGLDWDDDSGQNNGHFSPFHWHGS